MANTTYSEVLKKVTELGVDSLTKEEKDILKYQAPATDKMVNTDDYTTNDVDNIKLKQEHGIPLDSVEKTVLVGKEIDEKNKLVDVIIGGQNDVWEKTYDYRDDGGLKFTIAIKAPTIIEEGTIASRVQRYLGGTAMYWDDYTNAVYRALALIRTCGVKIPDVFKDDDHIYAVTQGWLYQIAVDFTEWQSRFRY